MNSGNTGGAKTFMTLGAAYLTAMTCGAMGQRVPREGWKPKGWEPTEQKDAMITTKSVHYNTALKTPQCEEEDMAW